MHLVHDCRDSGHGSGMGRHLLAGMVWRGAMMYKGHRRRIDPDARRALWEDQNRRCGYCGRKIGFSEVTVDHIIPLSRGGPDCGENMICSCRPCNEFKRNRTIEEFRAAVQSSSFNLMQREPEYRAVLRFGLIREYRRKRVKFYFETKQDRVERKTGKGQK